MISLPPPQLPPQHRRQQVLQLPLLLLPLLALVAVVAAAASSSPLSATGAAFATFRREQTAAAPTSPASVGRASTAWASSTRWKKRGMMIQRRKRQRQRRLLAAATAATSSSLRELSPPLPTRKRRRPAKKGAAAIYDGMYAVWLRSDGSDAATARSPAPATTSTKTTTTTMLPRNCTYDEVFESFGVAPPLKAPGWVWRMAYRVHKRFALPFLLHAFDELRPPNSDLSLMCLHWKAAAAANKNNGETTNTVPRMLPPLARFLIRRVFAPLCPKLHRANIDLRTAFLDRAVRAAVDDAAAGGGIGSGSGEAAKSNVAVRLITLGAGYDVRSVDLLEEGLVDEAYEIDLPQVVQAKRKLFESRLHPQDGAVRLPTLVAADLNEPGEFESVLRRIVSSKAKEGGTGGGSSAASLGGGDGDDTLLLSSSFSDSPSAADSGAPSHHVVNVILVEGVMVHLRRNATRSILSTCSEVLGGAKTAPIDNEESYFVFSDLLEGVKDRNLDLARDVLARIGGWALQEFVASPTRTPHMGWAKLQ